jgi:hypothetical protein
MKNHTLSNQHSSKLLGFVVGAGSLSLLLPLKDGKNQCWAVLRD